ncbi:MAG: DUF1638 domain-containing protein [Spirochaetaceae bacterium]|jgi:hypothetical protein|nr:DUF1638 domain-containing protein [Spirochaetaceae bacterium]
MIHLTSCGIFQWELEKVLPEIEKELGQPVDLALISPALDASEAKLERALRESAADSGGDRYAWLYGSMCHPNMAGLAEELGAAFPKPANCMEIFLGPEQKKKRDAEGNFYYISSGGLRLWRKIYQEERGMDEADARVNFGYFEKIIVLDTGLFPIEDEEVLAFYDFTQIPLEIEPIGLDYFKSVILDICRRAFRGP